MAVTEGTDRVDPLSGLSRIVFVNRYFYPDHSATAQILADLAFDLAREGRAVTVISSRQRYDDPAALLPADETIQGVIVCRVGGTRFGRTALLGRVLDYLSFVLAARRKLAQLVQPGDVVVAKTDPPLLGALVGGIVLRRGGFLVQWLQDVFPEVAEVVHPHVALRPVYALLRGMRDRWLRRSHGLVVVGALMREYILARGAESERLAVIPNWADSDAIAPLPHAENSLRKAWGLGKRFAVGYSGNLGRVHEFDGLLRAAARLRDDPDVVFLIIGAGAQWNAVRSEVERLGLANVLFQPYQERAQLRQSLAAIDLHIVSQRADTEGLVVPSKLYGVLAAGRPVLFLGDVDGEVARILRHHDCGYSVAADDAGAIVMAIESCSLDATEAAAMGYRARVACLAIGSRSKAEKSWSIVLDRVAAGAPIGKAEKV